MADLQTWDDVDTIVVSSTVLKKIVAGERATLVRLDIKGGSRAPRHRHDFEQFVQVISGGGILETDDGSTRFAAGAVFHFKPDTWHAARFDEDTILVETNPILPFGQTA